LSEYNSDWSSIQRSFTHGPGIDDMLGMTDYTGESAVDYFFHHDGMDSIVNITGGDETLMTTYDYGSFGDFTTTYHNGAIDSPFTYTGREFSAVTDMFHYRARNYMPRIGRFMSRDPYPFDPFFPNTIQRYNYCGNSPVNFVDPWGEELKFINSSELSSDGATTPKEQEGSNPTWPWWLLPCTGDDGDDTKTDKQTKSHSLWSIFTSIFIGGLQQKTGVPDFGANTGLTYLAEGFDSTFKTAKALKRLEEYNVWNANGGGCRSFSGGGANQCGFIDHFLSFAPPNGLGFLPFNLESLNIDPSGWTNYQIANMGQFTEDTCKRYNAIYKSGFLIPLKTVYKIDSFLSGCSHLDQNHSKCYIINNFASN